MPAARQIPSDLELVSPEGDRVLSGDLFDSGLTVVQLVRYFGCLPCQDWLVELDQRAGAWDPAQVRTLAVGGSADYQARWLRDERGVRTPLVLDPEHAFRTSVGAQKKLGAKLLDPRGAAAYGRSLQRGFRPQKITRDTTRSPGVVVVDRERTVRWQYVGRRIGDYPPMEQVADVVDDLLRHTS